jgi:hypothetical protein
MDELESARAPPGELLLALGVGIAFAIENYRPRNRTLGAMDGPGEATMNRAMQWTEKVRWRASILVPIWTFVVGVSIADAAFFWLCRETATDWEVNPVALLVLRCAGLTGVMIYRAAWLGFALFMAHTRTRLSWLITPVWATGHLYLLAVLMWSVRAAAG